SSSGGSFLPRSIMYSYLSFQLSNKANSSTISFSISGMVVESLISLTFLLLSARLLPVHQFLPSYCIPQTMHAKCRVCQNRSSTAGNNGGPYERQYHNCRAVCRGPADAHCPPQTTIR